MAVIPLMIDLHEKKVVIVGGGHVARRRLTSLLESEAELTVISPEILPEIADLYKKGKVIWKNKKVSIEDLAEAFLIIIATNDSEVNETVRKNAPVNCLINASTDAQSGNVHFPSHLKRGKLSIAVSTNGASPMLASKVKSELSTLYDAHYEQYVDFLFEARTLIKKSKLSKEKKESYLREFLDEAYHSPVLQQQTLQKLHSLF